MTLTATEIIERLWDNPEELQQFEADPKQFLIDNGGSIPDDVQVCAHIDTTSVFNVVLPINGSEMPEGDNAVLQVVRKAMEEPDFKAKLKERPKEALADEDWDIPETVTVNVFEDTPTQCHFVIPFNPAAIELSEADLESAESAELGEADSEPVELSEADLEFVLGGRWRPDGVSRPDWAARGRGGRSNSSKRIKLPTSRSAALRLMKKAAGNRKTPDIEKCAGIVSKCARASSNVLIISTAAMTSLAVFAASIDPKGLKGSKYSPTERMNKRVNGFNRSF